MGPEFVTVAFKLYWWLVRVTLVVDWLFLLPAYVVRREGNSFTLLVCPHLGGGGGVPISHNALQHFPECHGAASGGGGGILPGPARGGVPCQVQLGGGYPGWYPGRGVPSQGVPWEVPWEGVPWWGYPTWVPPGQVRMGGYPGSGYLTWVPPSQVRMGGTQLGQQKEYSLHGGQYASCIHAGLSCLSWNFGLVVGTYEGLFLFWECRWGGGSICRWWGHLNTTCGNWTFFAPGGGDPKTWYRICFTPLCSLHSPSPTPFATLHPSPLMPTEVVGTLKPSIHTLTPLCSPQPLLPLTPCPHRGGGDPKT